ncbi:hypothetical protein [Listeria booriae]|uniref:Uncharacterized protein n=1 Tax=Listeria booriae TaxID=1552123 RepID=A0A841XVV6_9LIST|nr:hypothetical protein [Listeria booriae]MBC1316916.1 hypothetical protein [Listeria booriae]
MEYMYYNKENIQYSESCKLSLGNDAIWNMTRMENVVKGISEELVNSKQKLDNVIVQTERAKVEINSLFSQEQTLQKKAGSINRIKFSTRNGWRIDRRCCGGERTSVYFVAVKKEESGSRDFYWNSRCTNS